MVLFRAWSKSSAPCHFERSEKSPPLKTRFLVGKNRLLEMTSRDIDKSLDFIFMLLSIPLSCGKIIAAGQKKCHTGLVWTT